MFNRNRVIAVAVIATAAVIEIKSLLITAAAILGAIVVVILFEVFHGLTTMIVDHLNRQWDELVAMDEEDDDFEEVKILHLNF